MKVPDWQQREAPARGEGLMNAQPSLEQHPGTPDQCQWGTQGKEGFAAGNSTHVSLRTS